MEFRPCIDIHNGKVKQIVGGTLRDEGSRAAENFVSEMDAAYYADLYRKYQLPGGHVILLNKEGSEYYEATKQQALSALREWPGGLEAGGGITPENASDFLDAGASHVIVTSYVFRDGRADRERLDRLVSAVGKDRLVLDLSCRRKNDRYYIVTDRWQKFTDVEVTEETLAEFASCCAGFLIHAADVEGQQHGVERPLIRILAAGLDRIAGQHPAGGDFPMTYAGGIRNFEDLDWIREAGNCRINVTIGSALDIFGGPMKFEEVLRRMK